MFAALAMEEESTGEGGPAGKDADVWTKIPFFNLQDLHFTSESDEAPDSSDEEDEEGGELKRLIDRAKARPEQLAETISVVFGATEGELTSKTRLEDLAQLEAAWSTITPQEFVITLGALSPLRQQQDYLDRLIVTVDAELLPRRQQKHCHLITMLFARTALRWSEMKPKGDDQAGAHKPEFNARRPGLRKASLYFDVLSSGGRQLNCLWGRPLEFVHTFGYTTAVQLFSIQDPRDRVYITKALLDAGRPSLRTPMGRALMLDHWLEIRFSFWVDKLVDMVQLCILSLATWHIRHRRIPGGTLLGGLLALSTWAIFCKILEIASALRLFRSLYVLSMSLVMFFLEFFNAIAILVLLWGVTDKAGQRCEPGTCPIYNHLTLFSLSILCKWAHFVSSVLCLRNFGENVLPAAYTLVSAESNRFLFVLVLAIVASYQAYCAYPVAGTIDETFVHLSNTSVAEELMHEFGRFHWENNTFLFPRKLLSMLVNMFRLDVMGDFDTLELQGGEPVIRLDGGTLREALRGNLSSAVEGHITDPPPNPSMHQGILVLFVVLCLFVNVILMNIYIGLLSSVYDNYTSQRWELLAEYKAMHALRYMLSSPRYVMAFFFERTRSVHQRCSRIGCAGPQPDNTGAVWVAYIPEEFQGEREDDSRKMMELLEWNSRTLEKVSDDIHLLKAAQLPEGYASRAAPTGRRRAQTSSRLSAILRQ